MADDTTPELTEIITVGDTPGGNGVAATSGTNVAVKALSGREYVAGSRLQWYINAPRSLAWSIDDITTDFGADIYERMLVDAQVRSVIDIRKAAILEDGAHLTCAIEDKEDPRYTQAADLVDRAERMLDNLTTDLDTVLWDMGDALALGNCMAEQVYHLDSTYTGKQEYVLERLAVKPRESVAFLVDAYLNVLGILGRIPGQPFAVQQGTLLADIERTVNLMPRAKFAVLTSRQRKNDPRGTSLLRAAFDPWNQKQQLKREFLKYLTQFASPSLVGYTAEEAETYQVGADVGNPQFNLDGTPMMRTPEMDMVAALEAFANGTVTAFQFGSKVDAIMVSGEGAAFINAFSLLDRQIAKAVLNQTLATEDGEHQTRASSGTHKDVLDTSTRRDKRPAQRMLSHDVLGTWLRLNGHEDQLDICPRVSLGSVETEDVAALWTAAAALHRSGYIDASQYPELDKRLSLPERIPPTASTPSVSELVTVKSGTIIPEEDPEAQDEEEDAGDNAGQPTSKKTPEKKTQRAPKK